MLPRSARLTKTVEIQRVLQTGRCITTPAVRVCFLPSGGEASRIACVVGKVVHQKAVRRHRYQRWLREVAREFVHEQLPEPSYDMVWVARPGILQIESRAALRASLIPSLLPLIST